MQLHSKPSKHDRYVADLSKKIRDKYDYLVLDHPIAKNKRMLGQVDLYGVKENNGNKKTDLYEVKCSFRIHKAIKQLRRARRLMNVHGNLFFYCGSSGQLQEIEG